MAARRRFFAQAYTTLGIVLRKGRREALSLASVTTRADASNGPMFGEASLAYGLPCDLTLYTACKAADFLWCRLVGVGKSLGSLGAISLDVTQAQTRPQKT